MSMVLQHFFAAFSLPAEDRFPAESAADLFQWLSVMLRNI